MGGLLGFIRAAMPLAADARAGYLQGQDQEEDKQKALARQSLLDQMKEQMDESTMDENRARGRYYDSIGDAKANPAVGLTYKTDADGNIVALPTRAPAVRPGASSGSGPASTPPVSSTPLLDQIKSGAAGDVNTPPTITSIPTGVKAQVKRPPVTSGVVNGRSVKGTVGADGTFAPLTTAAGDTVAAAIPPAPKLARSGSGYVQWNPTRGDWEPTGITGPAATSLSPEYQQIHRAGEIRKRMFDLMKPQPGKFAGMKTPGLDQGTALARATAEYDAAAATLGDATPTTSSPRKPPTLTVPSSSQNEMIQTAIGMIHSPGDYTKAKAKWGALPAWSAIDAGVPPGIKGSATKSGNTILPPTDDEE